MSPLIVIHNRFIPLSLVLQKLKSLWWKQDQFCGGALNERCFSLRVSRLGLEITYSQLGISFNLAEHLFGVLLDPLSEFTKYYVVE